jgi:L-ascorbate metabolism protein UlaG (beta-lactamase superfamily)
MIRLVFAIGAIGLASCVTRAKPAASTSSASPPATATKSVPLTLTYLGVAGWAIADGRHTVVIDPYLSRPSLADGVPIVPDETAIARHAPARVDLILIGHSHVDHVLDAPALAIRTGASIVGTVSTARYARSSGVPDAQIIPVKGGEDYAFDGFSVRVLPGLHSALDNKHTFAADQLIAAGTRPTTMEQFAEGGALNYLLRIGGRQILVIGSANFVERELEGLRPDIAIVATGLRDELFDYSCRLMRATGSPSLVLTNHFDDWTEPATTPLSEEARRDLAVFAEEIRACAPASRVVVPTAFEAMRW